MVADINPSRTGSEFAAREGEPAAVPGNGRAEKQGGRLAGWLPLLLNILLLPALAYAVDRWVLLPRMEQEIRRLGRASAADPAEGKSSSGNAPEAPGGKAKVTAPLSAKVLVNVAGTQGTRYLLANIVLVGPDANLKTAVDNGDAQLRDAASSILANKTIVDLEKPGSRNLIRSELVSAFNNILGGGLVKEIYFTEFAIQ
jgi:flagellar protein FliL